MAGWRSALSDDHGHGLDGSFVVALLSAFAVDLPTDPPVFATGLFAPFTAVAAVDSLDLEGA